MVQSPEGRRDWNMKVKKKLRQVRPPGARGTQSNSAEPSLEQCCGGFNRSQFSHDHDGSALGNLAIVLVGPISILFLFARETRGVRSIPAFHFLDNFYSFLRQP